MEFFFNGGHDVAFTTGAGGDRGGGHIPTNDLRFLQSTSSSGDLNESEEAWWKGFFVIFIVLGCIGLIIGLWALNILCTCIFCPQNLCPLCTQIYNDIAWLCCPCHGVKRSGSTRSQQKQRTYQDAAQTD